MQFTKKNCLSIPFTAANAVYAKNSTCHKFCFLPLPVFGNKHALFAMAWFQHGFSHRSQVHQNVPSNRSFTSSFALSSGLGTRSGLKRKGWKSTKSSSIKHVCQDKCLGQHDVTLSGLARPGRWVFVSKWRLSIANSGLLWRLISWDRMHFRSRNFGE